MASRMARAAARRPWAEYRRRSWVEKRGSGATPRRRNRAWIWAPSRRESASEQRSRAAAVDERGWSGLAVAAEGLVAEEGKDRALGCT